VTDRSVSQARGLVHIIPLARYLVILRNSFLILRGRANGGPGLCRRRCRFIIIPITRTRVRNIYPWLGSRPRHFCKPLRSSLLFFTEWSFSFKRPTDSCKPCFFSPPPRPHAGARSRPTITKQISEICRAFLRTLEI
jgi:hypothetical protein